MAELTRLDPAACHVLTGAGFERRASGVTPHKGRPTAAQTLGPDPAAARRLQETGPGPAGPRPDPGPPRTGSDFPPSFR